MPSKTGTIMFIILKEMLFNNNNPNIYWNYNMNSGQNEDFNTWRKIGHFDHRTGVHMRMMRALFLNNNIFSCQEYNQYNYICTSGVNRINNKDAVQLTNFLMEGAYYFLHFDMPHDHILLNYNFFYDFILGGHFVQL